MEVTLDQPGDQLDIDDGPEIALDEETPDGWDDEEWDQEGDGGWDDEEKDEDTPLPNISTDSGLKIVPMVRKASVMQYKDDKNLEEQMNVCVRPIMEMGFGFTLSQAVRIGYCFEWRMQKARNDILEKPEEVMKECGVSLEEKPPVLPDKGTVEECPVCYDDVSAEDFKVYLNCGHGFCQECWREEVAAFTQEGLAALNMTCPQHDCNLAITRTEVEKILKNGKTVMTEANQKVWTRYYRLMLKFFVDKNPDMSYCPANRCEIVHSYVKGMRRDLTCSCGHQFCWRCCNIAHNPCSCDEIDQWEKKYNDEAEDMNWIKANTKPCPKCGIAIEKNDGCMHMTCRSAIGCGYEFCWLCMADWKKVHKSGAQGGYYRCTIYDEGKQSASVKEADRKIAEEQEQLKRYSFHLNLYDNCLRDSKFAKNLEDTFKILGNSKSANKLSHVNWEFLLNVAKEIGRIKRMCAFIYVLLYYMPKDIELDALMINKKNLLKEQQAVLVTFSDNLQGMVNNKDIIDEMEKLEDLAKKRYKIEDNLKLAKRYRNNISQYINSDINKDCLSNIKD